MIFGSSRDSAILLHIRRELLHDIVEQECLYYKLDLRSSDTNIYGESLEKFYWNPVRLTCLIKRQDQEWTEMEYGVDLGRKPSFAFIKDDFRDLNCLPEPGDIIEWDKNQFFEVDAVKENQLWVGKNEDFRLDKTRTHKFGHSISIVCSTHLTRYSKLNLVDRA